MYDYDMNDIVIEGLLYDIALESENENKKPGRLKMMLANLCRRLAVRCKHNLSKANSNNHQPLVSLWNSLYIWFDSMYKKLSNTQKMLTDAELNTAKTTVQQKAAQVNATEKKQATQAKTGRKQPEKPAPQNQNEQREFTYTDGDLSNGKPKRSRKKAYVVRDYRRKARLCRENGDEEGYKRNMQLSDDAANNPDLNSMTYYDPNLETALEEFLGYDMYRYTITNGPNYITNTGFSKASESYLDDALEYESVIESLNSEDEFDDVFGDEFDSYCDFGEYDGEDSSEYLLL